MADNFSAAMEAMQLTPQEQFLYQYHLNNLYGPGAVWHDDGTVSTIYQTTVEVNGRTYNIPTVWDGQIVKPRQAIANAQALGLENFPSYASGKEAQSRYDQMHDYMERDSKQAIAQRQQLSGGAKRALDNAAAPGFLDWFAAGAQDFGEDVKGVLSGTSKGPSFTHRKKLIDRE